MLFMTCVLDKDGKDYVKEMATAIQQEHFIIENSFIEDKVFFSHQFQIDLLTQAFKETCGNYIGAAVVAVCKTQEEVDYLKEMLENNMVLTGFSRIALVKYSDLFPPMFDLDGKVNQLTGTDNRGLNEPFQYALKLYAVTQDLFHHKSQGNFQAFLEPIINKSVVLEGFKW